MFDFLAPSGPAVPVILSVPHAGRCYPADTARLARVPADRLIALEDRHVDLLAAHAPAAGAATLVARTPRAWIDLNRSEQDVDPAMIDPPIAFGRAPSAKVRGGLGLVPRRLAGVGDLWRAPLARASLDARIQGVHRPYHAALATAIADAHTRFGIAVLLDLHSMPPLGGAQPPTLVLGDRFGLTAGSRFTARLRGEAEAAGLRVALNAPYQGGHILERHGAPGRGIHAIQVEVDRALYLGKSLRTPDSAGVARLARFIATCVSALAEEALGGTMPIAAE
ncbi:N-formylglutamate amidohydrolase [Sphingomonas flavalba]|uniref:N-formylglutamate amidohydrolase n=1 Tax=Sphingomonas flavalba TaxID=2559804 RepID=UPI0039E069FD